MARRYGLGFYVTVAVLLAVFVNQPVAFLDVAWQMFSGIGEFGGAVVSELASGGGE
ncbi:MAG: hypothetical protein AAGA93_00615 [Actinomycetota bacterium]